MNHGKTASCTLLYSISAQLLPIPSESLSCLCMDSYEEMEALGSNIHNVPLYHRQIFSLKLTPITMGVNLTPHYPQTN
jgi:hypothetical protein